MKTWPHFRARARRIWRPPSRGSRTPATRPYLVPLAMAIASAFAVEGNQDLHRSGRSRPAPACARAARRRSASGARSSRRAARRRRSCPRRRTPGRCRGPVPGSDRRSPFAASRSPGRGSRSLRSRSNAQGPVAIGHQRAHLLVDRLAPTRMRDFARRAGLASVLDAGIDEEGQGGIEIGIGEDDLGRFSAELEGDGNHVLRRRRSAPACRVATEAGERQMTRCPDARSAPQPASAPRPVTTFSAPAGRPAPVAMRAKASAVRQASSAGFSTVALPMASAAPTLRPMICIG